MDVPAIIKSILEEFKLNNLGLSKILKVTNTTIDRYTKGRKVPNGEREYSKPTYDVIKKMVSELNINPYYLLGLSKDMLHNDETTIKYLIENNERLIKNPVFIEYLEAQKIQLKLEDTQKKVNEKRKEIETKLLEKLNEKNKT